MAYNSFLDGNLWKDSPSVDKFPFVAELSAGLGLNIYNARLTYTYVHRSNEFYFRKLAVVVGGTTAVISVITTMALVLFFK